MPATSALSQHYPASGMIWMSGFSTLQNFGTIACVITSQMRETMCRNILQSTDIIKQDIRLFQ
jgi:hypothetical protein